MFHETAYALGMLLGAMVAYFAYRVLKEQAALPSAVYWLVAAVLTVGLSVGGMFLEMPLSRLDPCAGISAARRGSVSTRPVCASSSKGLIVTASTSNSLATNGRKRSYGGGDANASGSRTRTPLRGATPHQAQRTRGSTAEPAPVRNIPLNRPATM